MSEISEKYKESKEENKKENTNIDKVIKMFERYFTHFGSIKSLDKNSDGHEVIYENIKLILNSSKFKIELFKREFKVYYNDNRKIEKKIFGNDGESNSFYEWKSYHRKNDEDLKKENKNKNMENVWLWINFMKNL